MLSKPWTVLALLTICIAVILMPVSAITTIENGGTVYAGENHYDFAFLDNSSCKLFGWWPGAQDAIAPSRTIDLTDHNDISFSIADFDGYDGVWRCLDPETGQADPAGQRFSLIVPHVITLPTPSPTPSEGNLIVSSYPSDATVYVDNYIKGITPLTVNVENGNHFVRIRLEGYSDSITSVSVNGNDITISPVLIEVTEPPTTAITTITTTAPTESITTEPTPEPTVTEELVSEISVQTTETPNYSETIAAIQSQVNVQATQIAEQAEDIDILQQLIDSIMSFLGLN